MIPDRSGARSLSTSVHRSFLLLWAVMAAANLMAGVVISTWPERQGDFRTVAEWGRLWLHGTDIYGLRERLADYPPHAIVLLSPLGILATHVGIQLWTALNLVLAIIAVHLAVRVWRPGDSVRVLLLPMLMFLCWGGFRTLLQFSLLALTFGLASTQLVDRRPRWSGVFLGLSLIKPQIAVPFVLWMYFDRRWRHILTAVGTAALGSALYCVRARASPLLVAVEYASNLRVLFTGEDSMHGVAQLRPLLAATVSDPTMVDVLAGGLGLILLAGICWLGVSERNRSSLGRFAAPSLAAVWSLLTFYHLTYGFLLLLPVASLLLFSDNVHTRVTRARLFWCLQISLMVDATTVWRWIGPSRASPALNALILHVDRLLAVALFVALSRLAFRSRAVI